MMVIGQTQKMSTAPAVDQARQFKRQLMSVPITLKNLGTGFWGLVLVTLANLGIGFWGLLMFRQSPHVSILLLLIVLTGMIYDNGVMLTGNWIGQGNLLKSLNRLRFVFHNLGVPLLVVVGAHLLGHTEMVWLDSPLAHYGCWGLTLGLIVLGLRDCMDLEMIPAKIAGMLHYKAKNSSVPIPTILTTLVIAGIGLSLWIQLQWPWLMLGTLLTVGNAIPPSPVRYHICAAVDFSFMLILFVTASQLL